MNVHIVTCAKINLALQVVSKRPDGYHNIRSIFHKINILDEIFITEIPDDKIEIITNSKEIPVNKDNIAFKAAMLMKTEAGRKTGLRIEIKKNIPVSAGLGGGSGNAAGVLSSLNDIWSLNFPAEKLSSLGAQLGSDVPFFINKNKSCLGLKKGEILFPLEIAGENKFILLIKPEINVSTKETYEAFSLEKQDDPNLQAKRDEADRFLFYLEKSYIKNIGCQRISLEEIPFYNDLETVSAAKYPVITAIKNKLLQTGAAYALMSGSGPSIFGIYNNMSAAEKAHGIFKKENNYNIFLLPF